MKKTNENLVLLNTMFIMSLLVANVIAAKIVKIWIFEVPSAVVAYAITFLCTDIINEIWGVEESDRTVKRGFCIQVTAMVLIYFAVKLPPVAFNQEFSEMFAIVFSQTPRMVLGSLAAYLVSQFNDVHLFNYLRKKTNGSKKWLRNNASTMVSQILDTAIFITIAFYGKTPNLLWMICSQYIVKWVLALCDTPFFYYFTRRNKGEMHGEREIQ